MHHNLMRVAYHILMITSYSLYTMEVSIHAPAEFAGAVEEKRTDEALALLKKIDINGRISSIRRTDTVQRFYDTVGTTDYPVPLAWAVFLENSAIIDALLADQRLNSNAANSQGATALHAAIAINNRGLVQRLLERGADPAAKIVTKQIDISGMGQHTIVERTALDLAQEKGNPQIIALLKNPPAPRAPEETAKHLRELAQAFVSLQSILQ